MNGPLVSERNFPYEAPSAGSERDAFSIHQETLNIRRPRVQKVNQPDGIALNCALDLD